MVELVLLGVGLLIGLPAFVLGILQLWDRWKKRRARKKLSPSVHVVMSDPHRHRAWYGHRTPERQLEFPNFPEPSPGPLFDPPTKRPDRFPTERPDRVPTEFPTEWPPVEFPSERPGR